MKNFMFIRVMLLDDKKWMSFGGSFKEGEKKSKNTSEQTWVTKLNNGYLPKGCKRVTFVVNPSSH